MLGQRSASEIVGLIVYSIDRGERVGEVDALMVRRAERDVPVVRLKVEGPDKQAFVEIGSFHTLGRDLALVDSDTVLHFREPGGPEPLDVSLIGRPVLTRSGEHIGRLVGFDIEIANGRIALYRVEADAGLLARLTALGRDRSVEVPPEMVSSLGPDAVLVEDAVRVRLHPETLPEKPATDPALA